MTVSQMASLGGKACARSRSPAERQRVARKAVQARWKRYREAMKAPQQFVSLLSGKPVSLPKGGA